MEEHFRSLNIEFVESLEGTEDFLQVNDIDPSIRKTVSQIGLQSCKHLLEEKKIHDETFSLFKVALRCCHGIRRIQMKWNWYVASPNMLLKFNFPQIVKSLIYSIDNLRGKSKIKR
jgi:hypothetical protein